MSAKSINYRLKIDTNLEEFNFTHNTVIFTGDIVNIRGYRVVVTRTVGQHGVAPIDLYAQLVNEGEIHINLESMNMFSKK